MHRLEDLPSDFNNQSIAIIIRQQTAVPTGSH
jgi:hypothetical protein